MMRGGRKGGVETVKGDEGGKWGKKEMVIEVNKGGRDGKNGEGPDGEGRDEIGVDGKK